MRSFLHFGARLLLQAAKTQLLLVEYPSWRFFLPFWSITNRYTNPSWRVTNEGHFYLFIVFFFFSNFGFKWVFSDKCFSCIRWNMKIIVAGQERWDLELFHRFYTRIIQSMQFKSKCDKHLFCFSIYVYLDSLDPRGVKFLIQSQIKTCTFSRPWRVLFNCKTIAEFHHSRAVVYKHKRRFRILPEKANNKYMM